MARIGFVGLGVMGLPMAGHLLNAKHDLTVWNRTQSKCDLLVSKGAKKSQDLATLSANCDIVFVCVSKSEDVLEVCDALIHANPELLIVDHSTIEPNVAVQIASRCKFVDAPVTGGEKGAIAGTLTIFCGGNETDIQMALPYLLAYGKNVQRVGKSGSGQLMKMANQISVAVSVLGMAECLVFCEKSGLDLKQSIELIGSGAGSSWSLLNYGPKVCEKDWTPGFAVDLQQKDLKYALDAAMQAGVCLPGTALTHQLFAALQNAGRGSDATPALFEVIENLSGKLK